MSVENPFLTPPQVESPQSRSWGQGWAYGFQGPAMSALAPTDIQPEDLEAFDMGVLAGQESAINGLELAQPCVDLNVEGPSLSHMAGPGVELGMVIAEVAKRAIAGAVMSGALFLLELSIALETFSDDPNARLEEAATALQGQLQQLGFESSAEFFLGGGVDTTVAGCELRLGSIFRDQESATNSAVAQGRPEWIVVSWRSDQSGGVTIVSSSAE